MAKEQYNQLIKKRLKDFPDYSSLIQQNPIASTKGDMPALADPSLNIITTKPILPTTKFQDLIVESALDKGRETFIQNPEKLTSSISDLYPKYTSHIALTVRDILKKQIGEEILKRKLDPASQLANPKDLKVTTLPKEESLKARGKYNPKTGDIRIQSGMSPEMFAGTLAHEIGHKSYFQGIGKEGLQKATPEKIALQGEDIVNYGKTLEPTRNVSVEGILEALRPHHGTFSQAPWEVETLKNIREKGILKEPMTKEMPEKYKKEYKDLVKKLKIQMDTEEKLKKLMGE